MKEFCTPAISCFIAFNEPPENICLPEKFTFPFYYDPHPLAVKAAEELQQHLKTQTGWTHNFGLTEGQEGMVIGKMFGVMVVQKPDGETGYLAAFSGKLAGGNHHARFVPPVFDMLTDGSFFLTGEEELNRLNREIEKQEAAPDFAEAKEQLLQKTEAFEAEKKQLQEKIKQGKQHRKNLRENAEKEPDTASLPEFLEALRKESIREQYFLKDLNRQQKAELADAQIRVNAFADALAAKKEERKSKSAVLQQKLFAEYAFLNQAGEKKSLLDIFETGLRITPPAGAGECAAPKLLQYAFLHGLRPIALAEFWWGASPASEVRKHRQFYPACRGKCEPILAHMLQGMTLDKNPMADAPDENIRIDTVYEDEHIVVIHKPAEFLSVPGITVQDSVYTRLRQKYPDASGPLMVHRLDMSTSGIMLIAKTRQAYHHLQNQFIKRSIKKRYVALLEGNLAQNEGVIDLPLRVNLDDRPRQLVCHEYGKPALTRWKVLERTDGKTRVHFFPVTGRTHQLRVHASHASGLNAPIVGDDLYGNKAGRLYLHAEQLEFVHPFTGQHLTLTAAADF